MESDNGTYETGIQIWQQPSFQGRLFVGKQRDNSVVLLMSDVEGRPRIRMQVAPDGTPKLEFLDEAGRVVFSLPGAPGASKP